MEDWIENLKEQLKHKEAQVESEILGKDPDLKKKVDRCDAEIGGMRMNYEAEKNSMTLMDKVRFERGVYLKDQVEKKPFHDEVKKRMLEAKKEQLAELEEDKRDQYKEAFDFDNHEKEVQAIEQQQLKERNTTPIPDEFGELKKAKDKAATDLYRATPEESQERIDLYIEHKGEVWHYEKRGFDESFSIEAEDGEKISTIRRIDKYKPFDEKGNASVEYKDAKTGEIVKNDHLPMDVEPALDIGIEKADEYFASLDRNNPNNDRKLSGEFDTISNPNTPPGEERRITLPGEDKTPQPKEDPGIEYDPAVEVPHHKDPTSEEQDLQFPGYQELPPPNNNPDIKPGQPIEVPAREELEEISLKDQFPGYDYVEPEESDQSSPSELREKFKEADLDAGFPGSDYYSGENYGYTPDTGRDFSPDATISKTAGPEMDVGDMD